MAQPYFVQPRVARQSSQNTMDTLDPKIFQVSVKGLHYREDGKLLMIQEMIPGEGGVWELPGGRLERGEELTDTLRRECREELGLQCAVLEQQPSFVYSTIGRRDNSLVMVFYKIHFDDLNFTPSNECVAIDFFDKEEIRTLNLIQQLKRLPDFL